MIKVSEKINEKNNNKIRIIKGSIISICITLIFLAIYAFILTYTSISESTIPAVTIIITMISVLISSSVYMSKIKKNGVINGILIGFIYIIFIYLLSSIIKGDFTLNIKSIIMIIGAMTCGSVGGIIGVNRK